jgi:hypothetical protein
MAGLAAPSSALGGKRTKPAAGSIEPVAGFDQASDEANSPAPPSIR